MNQKILKRVLCIILAAVLVFSFSACRRSPVLEKIQYTDNAKADQNNQQKNNDENNTNEDQQISSKDLKKDTEKQRNQDNSAPKKGDDKNSQSARQENYNQSGADRSNAETGQNQNGQNQQNIDQQDNGGNGETPAPSVEEDPNATREMTDANGVKVVLPKNVEHVSATGDAALYVEMLGGTNRLAATSANVKKSALAQSVFSDLSEVPVIWDSNGENAVNGGAAAVPQGTGACFVISGYGSFADGDLTTASNSDGASFTCLNNEQKTPVITLYPFNTTEHIKKNVEIIGEVLGKPDGSEVDARQRASDYNSWFDSIISEAYSKNKAFTGPNQINFDSENYSRQVASGQKDSRNQTDGKYTLLVDHWNGGISYSIGDISGSGLPIVKTNYSKSVSPASYFLSLGGAANMAALTSDDGAVRARAVTPIYNMYISRFDGQELNYKNKNQTMTMGSEGAFIGTEKYSMIIANSVQTKSLIESSNAWQFAPEEHQQKTGALGETNYGVFVNGTISPSNVHGDYTVVVNPYGAGDWKTGSPESPLEALWAYKTFNDNSYDLNSAIADFYARFYNHTLSSAELEMILNGQD